MRDKPPPKSGEDGTVNLKITIDEGRRFKLRHFFLNVDELTAKLLRQKINLKDNEFYNQREFEKGIEEINKLNLFRFVDKDKDSQFSFPVSSNSSFLTISVRIADQ